MYTSESLIIEWNLFVSDNWNIKASTCMLKSDKHYINNVMDIHQLQLQYIYWQVFIVEYGINLRYYID